MTSWTISLCPSFPIWSGMGWMTALCINTMCEHNANHINSHWWRQRQCLTRILTLHWYSWLPGKTSLYTVTGKAPNHIKGYTLFGCILCLRWNFPQNYTLYYFMFSLKCFMCPINNSSFLYDYTVAKCKENGISHIHQV